MRLRALFGSLALLVALGLPTVAKADSFTFTFTPYDQTPVITFNIPFLLIPDVASPGNYVSYNFGDPNYVNVTFLDSSLSALLMLFGYGPLDLEIDNGYYFYYVDGPQLYTGPVSAPNFTPGTYELSNDPANNGDNGNQVSGGRLVITSDQVSPVPEPSSFLLLGTGMLGAFGTFRRRFHKG